MARHSNSIPTQFDADFLDWFRAHLEATWATLPQRTPEDVLAEYVRRGVGGSTWQAGTRWLTGLNDDAIAEVECRWQLTLPPDFRLFLLRLHSVDRPRLRAHYLAEDEFPQTAEAQGALATALVERYGQHMALEEGPSFYNWLTEADALEARLAQLWEGLQFDVEFGHLWLPSWGPKPATLEAQKRRARELVEGAPRLIPIFDHRYLLADPSMAGNPILSIVQSDIIIYGADLRSYFLVEFADLLGIDRAQVRREADGLIQARYPAYTTIPFWGDLLDA